MPTNYLRRRNDAVKAGPGQIDRGRRVSPRIIEITVGGVTLRAEILDSPTAERLWTALPLFSTAERWGDAVHFEIPVPSGRERNARTLGEPGLIYFWSHEERLVIPFGKTPISRPGEVRLPAPCNIVARSLVDTSLLKCVSPGEKVSVKAATKG